MRIVRNFTYTKLNIFNKNILLEVYFMFRHDLGIYLLISSLICFSSFNVCW